MLHNSPWVYMHSHFHPTTAQVFLGVVRGQPKITIFRGESTWEYPHCHQMISQTHP